MRIRTIAIAMIASAGACAHPARPVLTPAPNVAPVASAPVVPQGPAGQTAPAPTTSADAVDASAVDAATRRPADVPVEPAPVAAADATAVVPSAEPSWDIEVRQYESTDRVEHYLDVFSGRAKEQVEQWLSRGTRYEGMIRDRMRAGGIPEDMYYLALVESGFDPNAYSRAAAVGMWQFMTSTARDMGLRVDWWVDERRDPFKSTTAAVRFIKDLREQFGSLYLAAAAYNGGPGRVARGLSRYADDLDGMTGDDQFFALADKKYLRNETREYVPQLIAAALIAKEPSRYGVHYDSLPPVTYDSVRVGPTTALVSVARAAHIGPSDIKDLNPHVLRGVTPPRDSFYVRIPAGSRDSVIEALAHMPLEERRGLFTVESKKGESVASLARKHGVSSRHISLYNPNLRKLKPSGNLVPGQAIFIPTAAVAEAAPAVAVPDPSIERYGPVSGSRHVVRRGETLGGIALRAHTTVAALMRLNGLKKPMIFAGQTLIIRK